MKIQVKIIVLLMFLFVLAMAGCGSSGGDGAGAGDSVTPPIDVPTDPPTTPPTTPPTEPPTCTPQVDYYIHLKGTTYNMQDAIIDVKEQVVNLALKDKLPSQLNAYETYAGVQIEMLLNVPDLLKNTVKQMADRIKNLAIQLIFGIVKPADIDLNAVFNLESIMADVMGSIKQTPLLLQFWALEQMKSSVNPGKDGQWFTSDDTIDATYGYFNTYWKECNNYYIQDVYSDFGKTRKGIVTYTLNADGLKSTVRYYDAKSQLVRTTEFKYNADKQMKKATNRDAQGNIESVYKFTYENGLLQGMRSYDAAGKLLGGGSYTILEWSENNAKLRLTLGLQVNFKWVLSLLKIKLWDPLNVFEKIKPIDLRFLTIDYVFDTTDPKVITESTEYGMLKKPLAKNIDTFYQYFYDGTCAAMSGGTTYDWSKNFDLNFYQKSTTRNELSVEVREVPCASASTCDWP